mmetsp:Transcript_30388/g.64085  ORF Transcript_30388/g.64085 Transcript_30388/m.64085 type:complete len:214 (+) Transcript_30388:1452-2093(+)
MPRRLLPRQHPQQRRRRCHLPKKKTMIGGPATVTTAPPPPPRPRRRSETTTSGGTAAAAHGGTEEARREGRKAARAPRVPRAPNPRAQKVILAMIGGDRIHRRMICGAPMPMVMTMTMRIGGTVAVEDGGAVSPRRTGRLIFRQCPMECPPCHPCHPTERRERRERIPARVQVRRRVLRLPAAVATSPARDPRRAARPARIALPQLLLRLTRR